jgi:hypothetical protein
MLKHPAPILAIAAILILSFASAASAHKPLLAVEDNMDGTIYIEAGFSDGSSAAGHKILLKDKESGKVLSEQRVGEDGTLEIKKPSVKYTVTLDAGEGHVVTKDGPPPDTKVAKADKAAEEKQSPAPTPKPTETVSSGAQPQAEPKPVASGPSPGSSKVSVATSGVAASAIGVSPGAIMAFKMMMITQVVTAVALIFLVVIIAYYVGYIMGRNSSATS